MSVATKKEWLASLRTTPEPKTHGKTVLPLPFWFAIACLAFLLAGCASQPQVPECERYWASEATDEYGRPGMFIPGSELGKLRDMIQGLAHGTCRFPSRGTIV